MPEVHKRYVRIFLASLSITLTLMVALFGHIRYLVVQAWGEVWHNPCFHEGIAGPCPYWSPHKYGMVFAEHAAIYAKV